MTTKGLQITALTQTQQQNSHHWSSLSLAAFMPSSLVPTHCGDNLCKLFAANPPVFPQSARLFSVLGLMTDLSFSVCVPSSGNLDKQTGKGSTALHYCCLTDNAECLKLLLRGKASIEIGKPPEVCWGTHGSPGPLRLLSAALLVGASLTLERVPLPTCPVEWLVERLCLLSVSL